MLNCNDISDVIVFSSFSKIKDSTCNEAYDCTREDDKMAPRFCSVGDLSRYHLRAPKPRRIGSSIDTATVNNKIDFLRCMGLALSASLEELSCELCQQVQCLCDIQTSRENFTSMKQTETLNIPVKPCRVLIAGDQCKVCKKLFKCETDVRDHMKKRHKHRLKVILKLNNETVSTKWIKRSHLKRRRSHSDNHDGYRQGDQVSQTSPDSCFDSRIESRLGCDVSHSKIRRIDRSKQQDDRPCSAPSLGVSFDLPLCQNSSCRCCIRNPAIPWDDNNNCSQSYSPTPRESFESPESSPIDQKTSSANIISCQTPDWLQKSTTSIERVEDIITLDDSEDASSVITEIPVDPPCYDLQADSNYQSDDEVEKVLEIRKNQSPFITIKHESSEARKGLRISDALRDLMSAENSLSCHEDQHDGSGVQTHNFYQDFEKSMENDDDDEGNNFTLRFDDDEESCTFVIKDNVGNKEYSKGFSGDFFDDTHLDVAVDHHDALEQSSGFWQTTGKNIERFSSFEEPSEYFGNRNSSIAVKEELNLDHYLFDSE